MTTELNVDQSIDQRLLEAAIDHFGRKGLEGASTRAIAAAAGTTMSSITYHYGGKEGLYLAAVRHIANQIGEHLDPALASTDLTAQDSGPEAASRTVLHRLSAPGPSNAAARTPSRANSRATRPGSPA